MRVAQGVQARMVGAGTGAASVLIALVLVALAWRGATGLDQLLERPALLLQATVVGGVVGWLIGPIAASVRRRALPFVGALAGLSWLGLDLLGLILAAYVDAAIRGGAPAGFDGPLVWAVYGLVILTFYAAIPLTLVGLAWAVATRWLITRLPARGGGVGRHSRLGPARVASVAFALSVVVTGAVQAGQARPSDARCLDLGSERPVAGGWSPDGSLLAIASTSDPNEPGHIHLFRWPTQELVGRWTGWVDQTVAVDAAGRVYWSAWVLGLHTVSSDEGSSGIFTAAPGEEVAWLTSDARDEEATLWSMSWTADGILGITPNSHRVALAPLAGPDRGRLIPRGDEAVGVAWASPDGAWLVTSDEWFAKSVRVHHDGVVHMVPTADDPRSIGMTADRRTVVVATWGGGTRAVDVETGRSSLILHGQQAWIAVSDTGLLAWADDESYGPGVACVVPLRASQP